MQKLTNLDWLELSGTQITDESLKYFKNFKKLIRLNVEKTRVTETDVKDLKKDLPQTEIIYTLNGEEQSLFR
jgi:hypothetical protein